MAIGRGYAVGTAIEVVHVDGGSNGNVDDGATGKALLIASAIDRVDVATNEIYNGCSSNITIRLFVGAYSRSGYVHTNATIVASTEHFHAGKLLDICGYVDEHIAVVLQQILVTFVVISLSASIDACYAAVFSIHWAEVDECIANVRLDKIIFNRSVTVGVLGIEGLVLIVVGSLGTSKYVVSFSLDILNIGRSL